MDYAIVTEPGPKLLRDAVALHYQALSDRSFITAFGRGFLSLLYEGILRRGDGFLVVATEGGELVGFVLASTDSARLASATLHAPVKLAVSIVPALVRHPRLIARLFETLSYERRQRVPVPAELLVIAVVPESRSLGVGGRLLEELRNELRSRGIESYKVTVHEDMSDANRFYLQRGLRLSEGFTLYGLRWNVYVDQLR